MEFIKQLNWRYATKLFDASKKVEESDIALLEEAIRLAPSSYGFQPFKVFVITDQSFKQKLLPITHNKVQVVDASHLFVFCAQLAFTDEQVDNYLHLKAHTQKIDFDSLKKYGDFMKGRLKEKSPETMKHWTAKQTYLALGNLINACAILAIDACPIEGFESDKYDKLLGLENIGLTTTVLAAVGYRSQEDKNQHLPKVRKAKEDLFLYIE